MKIRLMTETMVALSMMQFAMDEMGIDKLRFCEIKRKGPTSAGSSANRRVNYSIIGKTAEGYVVVRSSIEIRAPIPKKGAPYSGEVSFAYKTPDGKTRESGPMLLREKRPGQWE